MPTKQPKKKPYKKRKTYRKKKTQISKLPYTGFPARKIVKLKYVESFVLDAGTSTVAYQEYRCNSLYDPNASFGGHQPMGFDQWATIYNRYSVISSKIIVTFNPSVSTHTTPGVWGVLLCQASGDISGLTPDQVIEQKYQSIRQVKSAGGLDGVSRVDRTAVSYFSAKKHFGLGKGVIVNHERNSSLFTTNPADVPMFAIWVGNVAANDPNPQSFTVHIDYVAILHEPKDIPQS